MSVIGLRRMFVSSGSVALSRPAARTQPQMASRCSGLRPKRVKAWCTLRALNACTAIADNAGDWLAETKWATVAPTARADPATRAHTMVT